MLLRCHGYPQHQASIPGYRPAVPELLPGAWAGARAIWEQRRRGLEGLGFAVWSGGRMRAPGMHGGAALPRGQGEVPASTFPK